MAYTENAWLEKFEIKKPDYDLKERDYVGMESVTYPPARYVLKGGQWKAKKVSTRLFGKKQARIMFVGDITCFEKQFEEAQNGKDYDFSYELEKVKPIFAKADLVVGNLETMIFPDAPYRTEKYVSEQNFHCNAPIEFLDAIRKAGIDVLTNANNHDLDTGAIGIGETIDHVERMGFIQTGTFKTDKKRYEIIDVSGFKIAVVAFATEHNNKRCNLTQEGAEFLLNDYSRENAEKILAQARKDGAELVFVCIHWGRENKTVHNSAQTATAQELAEMGYDCIIGSHPHVLQPFEILDTEDDREVPVFYSMGNFLSHNANNQKARSIIACIDLERIGQTVDVKCSYIPIFTSKAYGSKKYVVLPINANPIDPRNVRRKQQIEEVIGDEIGFCKEIKFMETVEKFDPDIGVQKQPAPDLTKVSAYPVAYSDGRFTYDIYKSYVKLTGLAGESINSSYSIAEKILKLPVSELEPGAFEGSTVMKKINFCRSLTTLSERACKDCRKLEGFQLGRNITRVGEEAFAGCVSLSAVVMRSKVTTIESGAFRNCRELRSVKIPPNVVSIADDAFEGCEKAVFYCERGSYAEQYAQKNGFKIVHMKLD